MAQTALYTHYKDYLPPSEGRKYRITQLEDGLCSIEDVTEYLQQGDTFGAKDINATNQVINDAFADFSMEENEMPYRWIDGTYVYRTVLQYAPGDFTSATKSLWVAGSTGSKQITMPELTKTGLLNQAASILPMSCACAIGTNGGFRSLSYARPEMPTYAFGWRLDKEDYAWTLAVSPGELDLSSISKLIFVIYYTK